MKVLLRKIILLFICLMPLLVSAQETKTDANNSPAATKAQRKKAKQKWKEARIVDRGNKKVVKDYHTRLQTKKTLKAMKIEKRKGDKMRDNKKKNFFQRMLKKK